MSSLELFPISQLIHLKLQHTVAKPAEHSDDKRGEKGSDSADGQRRRSAGAADEGTELLQALCTAFRCGGRCTFQPPGLANPILLHFG